MKIHPSTKRALAKCLLTWFEKSKRDLPWRRTKDPYAILVSEIMLQQTQAQTVIPYFERFMDKFPSLQVLAEAEEEEVFRLWSGLGYYRRARNLQATAGKIVTEFDGKFPETRKGLLTLPGIGPYTAGALLSIAFGQPEPLVDGNVERVLSRVLLLDDDLATTSGKKRIWELAGDFVPKDYPGQFNQSLMELGATICFPTTPKCSDCPLGRFCRAHLDGNPEALPVKSKSNRKEKVSEVVLIIRHQNRWLLIDHNEEELYDGLWQFPWAWQKKGDRNRKSTIRRLAASVGADPGNAEPVLEIKHAVTYRSITTQFYRLEISKKLTPRNGVSLRWVSPEDIGNEALPSYQKKALQALGITT